MIRANRLGPSQKMIHLASELRALLRGYLMVVDSDSQAGSPPPEQPGDGLQCLPHEEKSGRDEKFSRPAERILRKRRHCILLAEIGHCYLSEQLSFPSSAPSKPIQPDESRVFFGNHAGKSRLRSEILADRRKRPLGCRDHRLDAWRLQNVVTHIAVSLPVPNKSDWPSVVPDPAPGVKFELRVNTPHLPFVQLELRTLQGALAPYGVRAIDIEEPLVKWLPESDEERRQIGFNNYSRRSTRPDPNSFEPVPFDLVARAVIATDKLMEFETPLNFFRRGCRDIEDRQYVDAIYDFYFVLETLFANGKFKTSAVVEEFLTSQELCAAVDLLLRDPGPTFTTSKTIIAEFVRTYGPLGREKLIDKCERCGMKALLRPNGSTYFDIDGSDVLRMNAGVPLNTSSVPRCK